MDTTTIDLTDPELWADGPPHGVFQALRAEAPVHWNPEVGRGYWPPGPGFWSVTCHSDVGAVLRDGVTFSAHLGSAMPIELPPEELEKQRSMLMGMDPPQHTAYRGLVNRGFKPKRVSDLEPWLRGITDDVVARALEKDECDFVEDVAGALPLNAICQIVGVPIEDRKRLFDWSSRIAGQADPEFGSSREAAIAAEGELRLYVRDLIAEKRSCPVDDVMSALIAAEVDGHRLSELEIEMFVYLLAVAGNETTRDLIAGGMEALFRFPGEWERLQADRTLIPSAVQEMLRWVTPSMHIGRTASRDTLIGDQEIAAGQKVVVWYISANRDERVFEDPLRFDVGRAPNDHLAFSAGPHYCLGASLAKLEATIMFEVLLEKAPKIAQVGEAERVQSHFASAFKRLPVRMRGQA